MIFSYVSLATIYMFFLIFQIAQDREGIKRPITWVALFIATLLWPIVLPISCIELINKFKSQKEDPSFDELSESNIFSI
ncbi:MAG: hypothetical protein Tsb0014_08850 [Pleurocapsa sp.]